MLSKENYPMYAASYGVSVCGLTTRELFAAMAMQGLCACQGAYEEWTVEQKAAAAVRQADALIAELNKPKGA